jgi:hypothetical protein
LAGLKKAWRVSSIHVPLLPFSRNLGSQFLGGLSTDADPLVREVAATELHLMTLDDAEVQWDRNPDDVFAALNLSGLIPPPDLDHSYTLRVGRLLRCERVKIAG